MKIQEYNFLKSVNRFDSTDSRKDKHIFSFELSCWHLKLHSAQEQMHKIHPTVRYNL